MPINKNTPEYKVFDKYLGRICSGLSELPESITPVATDLRSAGIIGPQCAIFGRGISPYECAKTIIMAALSHVAQFPEKLEVVIEKLSDHGLNGLAKDMQERLDDFIKEEKKPTVTTSMVSCGHGHRSMWSTRSSIDLRGSRSGSEHREGSSATNPILIDDVDMDRPLKNKQQLKILVVGHNGSGKSSLINEIVGQGLATVGGSVRETTHDVVVKHRCKVGEVDVTIFDTRGFGDSSMTDKSAMNKIIDGIESIDIVLICHKLYDRVDGIAKKEIKVLVDKIDDRLIDLSILVFTFGDEYQTRCDPECDKESGKLTNESKEKIRKHMKTQEYEIVGLFKDVMKENGISDEHADRIPSCITCGKRRDNGEQKELPTSDDWIKELWDLCDQRCKPEARPLVHSTRKIVMETLGIVGNRILARLIGKKK